MLFSPLFHAHIAPFPLQVDCVALDRTTKQDDHSKVCWGVAVGAWYDIHKGVEGLLVCKMHRCTRISYLFGCVNKWLGRIFNTKVGYFSGISSYVRNELWTTCTSNLTVDDVYWFSHRKIPHKKFWRSRENVDIFPQVNSQLKIFGYLYGGVFLILPILNFTKYSIRFRNQVNWSKFDGFWTRFRTMSFG